MIVGGADGFRDEDIDYAMRLNQCGVPTELHVLPGAPHGVQMFAGSGSHGGGTDLVTTGSELQLQTMSSACAECGLDPERLTVDEAADLIAALGPQYRAAFAVVEGDRDRLRAKPDPDVWSSLEYVVHLRDSVRYHGALTNRALKEDRPEFGAPGPRRDRAERELQRRRSRRGARQPRAADDTLRDAGPALGEDELDRVVIRAGNEITVRYMVRNVAHEGHHHLQDVQRLLA